MLTLVARDSASADSSALSWAAPKGAQRVGFGVAGPRESGVQRHLAFLPPKNQVPSIRCRPRRSTYGTRTSDGVNAEPPWVNR
jgi:hypothetical protein